MRTAILLDENGKEIFRGRPADMPLRFNDNYGGMIVVNANQLVNAGTPIDDDGEDMELVDE